MKPKTYEVLLQETRTYAIRIEALDDDEAEQLAIDLYLHSEAHTEPQFRLVDEGGCEVLHASPVATDERTTHAVR